MLKKLCRQKIKYLNNHYLAPINSLLISSTKKQNPNHKKSTDFNTKRSKILPNIEIPDIGI
jgi:hypothetical protein